MRLPTRFLLIPVLLAFIAPSCSDDPAAPGAGAAPPIASFVAEWDIVLEAGVGNDIPISFAASPEGKLLFTHPLSHRIAEYSAWGNLVNEWKFSVEGEEFAPVNVRFCDGRYYVRSFTKIAVFDDQRNLLGHWERHRSTQGIGSGGPRIAVDSKGLVYELLFQDELVVKYSPTGDFMEEWSTVGPNPAIHSWPHSLVIDSSDILYIADTLNHRILRFSTSGALLDIWGESGSGPGQFRSPSGLAISDGFLYVVDRMNYRVQKFDLNGKYQGEVASRLEGTSGSGDAPYELNVFDGNLFILHPNIAPKIRRFVEWKPRL